MKILIGKKLSECSECFFSGRLRLQGQEKEREEEDIVVSSAAARKKRKKASHPRHKSDSARKVVKNCPLLCVEYRWCVFG